MKTRTRSCASPSMRPRACLNVKANRCPAAARCAWCSARPEHGSGLQDLRDLLHVAQRGAEVLAQRFGCLLVALLFEQFEDGQVLLAVLLVPLAVLGRPVRKQAPHAVDAPD